MKTSHILLGILLLVVVCTTYELWFHVKSGHSGVRHEATLVTSNSQLNASEQPNLNHRPIYEKMPSRSQWEQYAMTRQQIIHDDSDLATEYAELQTEAEAHRRKLESAMIQSDPQVAPIIAKLERIRKSNMGAFGRPSAIKTVPIIDSGK